jgi:hypothetical protein
MKRLLIRLIALGLLATIASIARHDGTLTPVNPDISITIPGSRNWIGGAVIVARSADPEGVYVVVPEMAVGEEFAAVQGREMCETCTSSWSATSTTIW